MNEAQFERGLMQLYESISVRDELSDSEGEKLLKWGERQVEQIAGRGLDDAAFDEQIGQLTRLMTRMNRLAARRATLTTEDQQLYVERLAQSAAACELPLDRARIEAYMQQPVAFTEGADIDGVIDLLSPPTDTTEESRTNE